MNPQQIAPVSSPAAPASQLSQDNEQIVPDSWPGAFGLYKYSKAAVLLNLNSLLIFSAIIAVIYGLSMFLSDNSSPVSSILSTAVSTMIYCVYIASVRNQKITVNQAFNKFFEQGLWWRVIVNSIILIFMMIGALLLFIVPFILLLPRITLVPYFLIDKQAGPIEAIKLSVSATKGHSGKAWGIIGANVAMFLLMITVIGIPFAIYFLFMYGAAYAVLYEFLTRNSAPAAVNPPPAVN